MKKLLFIPLIACAMMLQACAGAALGGTPPQLPTQWANSVRSAVAFAFNSFDAALYGVDAAVAAGKLTPGSATAKRVAAAGRTVQRALNAAEAARKVGNSTSYEAAFAQANAALSEFKALLGNTVNAGVMGPPLTSAERSAILDRIAA